jgi:hypothetical protein
MSLILVLNRASSRVLMVMGRSGGRVTPSRAWYSPRRVVSFPNNNEKTLLLYSRLGFIDTNIAHFERKGKEE